MSEERKISLGPPMRVTDLTMARLLKAQRENRSYAVPSIGPCPCCASTAQLCRAQAGAGSIDVARYIQCTNPECGVMTPLFYTSIEGGEREGVLRWNRRPYRGGH